MKPQHLDNQQLIDVLQDTERLAIIESIGLTDVAADDVFDRLTRHATRILPTPVSLVSVVTSEKQFFKSAIGLNESWASTKQMPLIHSFCQHVVASTKPLIIEDARQHPLVKDKLANPDLGVISYLGIPLTMQNGHTLGSFCVIDTKARDWTEGDIATVTELAQITLTQLEMRYKLTALRSRVQQQEHLVDELEIATHYLESIVETQSIFIVRTDLQGNYTYINNAMYQRYIWLYDSRETMVGAPSLDTIIEDDHPKMYEVVERCLLQPDASHQVMLRKPTADGGFFWALWELNAIRKNGGDIQEIQCVGIDITDRKRAEEQAFDLAIEREKVAVALVSRFIQHASHEFRTPLSIININANLIPRMPTVEQQEQKAQKIVKQTQRITKLVDTLTLFTKLETTNAIELKQLNLNVLLQSVVTRMLSASDTTPAIDLRLTNRLPHISGDEESLEKAFKQLLDNAIRFTPDDGTITIRTGIESDTVYIGIEDTGCGIDNHDMAHIFETFWRKDKAGTTPGFGLGLSIAKKIMDLHNGYIGVSSTPEKGTVVRCTFSIQ